MTDWKAWADKVPEMPERERYTATLLLTLSRILETAPFDWALAGGTALQSFFDEALRRYSSDVEITTKASKAEVSTWMKSQGWPPEPVGNANILKAALTPDGTLFVIHSYDPTGFAATEPTKQPFRHFPVKATPPPGQLTIPILDYDFLIAAKIWEIRKPGRGGERFKDAHDLSLGLPKCKPKRVHEKLVAYLKIRGDKGTATETVRAAGAWIQHFQGAGKAAYKAWQPQYLNEPDHHGIDEGLANALRVLTTLHGGPIAATASEQRRFLLADVTPKQLAPIATKLGWTKPHQYENMRDHVASAAFSGLAGPAPTTTEGLVQELEALVKARKPQ